MARDGSRESLCRLPRGGGAGGMPAAAWKCNRGCVFPATIPAVDHRTRWVLLAYRLPREPSTPRITLWRQLRRLGVAQIADGVVALPLDARTREQLEWLAEDVVDNGGEA